MRAEREHVAAVHTGVSKRLSRKAACHHVGAGTAVFLGKLKAEKTHGAQLFPHLKAEFSPEVSLFA